MQAEGINAPKIELSLADKEYSDIRRYHTHNLGVLQFA
jgi:hypothetical protein